MSMLTESIASQVKELVAALGLRDYDMANGDLTQEEEADSLRFPNNRTVMEVFRDYLKTLPNVNVEGVYVSVDEIYDALIDGEGYSGAREAFDRAQEAFEQRMLRESEWVRIVWKDDRHMDAWVWNYPTAEVVRWIKNAETVLIRRKDKEGYQNA